MGEGKFLQGIHLMKFMSTEEDALYILFKIKENARLWFPCAIQVDANLQRNDT